jgi:hypothetical protein
MNNMHEPEREIDPRLQEKLDLLRNTPQRDPEAVRRGRERFLAELDAIPELSPSPPVGWLAALFGRKSNPEEGRPVTTRTQKFAFTTLALAITVLVLLFGSAGATALAAKSALPGDALYPVKTGLEQTQTALAGDAYAQAQLHLQFAERRLTEIAALIQEGRFEDVETASRQFEFYAGRAMAAVQTVMAGDPQRGAELSQQVTSTLLRYAQTLRGMAVNVPDAARPAVEKAILASHGEEIEFTGVVEAISGSTWTIAGRTLAVLEGTEIKDSIAVGDTVKVHAFTAADGALTAREIERSEDLIGDDDNENDNIGNDNSNDNLNDNGNDNLNDNGNDNLNDNGNDNLNDNGNDNQNDNGNDNQNDNGNDNLNDNGDDNQNDNGNDNQNDNGDDNQNDNDNGNDNENQNDNGNDNGNDNENQNDNGDDNGNDNGNQNDNGNDNGDDNGNDNGNNNGNDNGNDNGGGDNDNDDGGNDNGGNDNSFNPMILLVPMVYEPWFTRGDLA